MIGRTRLFGAALAASALLLGGCSDSTAPNAPFDPARAEADLAAIETVMSSQQLTAFSTMSLYFDVGGGASAAVSSARAMLSSGQVTPATARQVAMAAAQGLALRTSGGSAPSLAVLPSEVLGTTFVFDPETESYVASDRTGAPANGVRFIVYAIDPLSGTPIVGTEVGHADLIDTSPSSQTSAGVRLVLVGGSTTYLDYAFTATGTQNSALLGVNGFLTDGTTRVNFDIDASMAFAQEQLSIDIDFSFTVPSRSFSITGAMDGIAGSTGGSGEVSLTIVSGGTHVRFEIAEDASTLNATVYVNNKIFATITGDPESPTVAGAGGAELTAEEAEALGELLYVAEGVFEFFGMLLAPIDGATGGGFVP
jgi:hypothetical protein